MKRIILPLLALCLALCLSACAKEPTTVTFSGREYPLDTTELDLHGENHPDMDSILRLTALTHLDLRDTGITSEEFDALHLALPECDIVWSVPFQEGYVDSDTQSLTLTALTAEDLAILDYFPGLARVDATQCPDADALWELAQHRPDCQVDYILRVEGVECPPDARELTLPRLTPGDLEQLLRHLPGLEKLILTEVQEDPEPLLNMMEANPDITFCWETVLYGVKVDCHADFLDFSDIAIDDLPALEGVLERLPDLTQVDMLRCGISNEDMDALNRRHENIQFVWEIDFGHVQYRTDITWFMPCQDDLWLTNDNSCLLNYFTELECLDLGHNHINDCSYVANMPKLRYLLLGDTYISDIEPLRGLENVVYLEIFMTHVKDYTPILSLKNLEVLNLSYTQGDPDVVAQMTWVDYIRWVNYEHRSISMARKEQLRQELPDTLLELEIATSSTGGMWRKTQHYFDMRDMVGMYYMVG